MSQFASLTSMDINKSHDIQTGISTRNFRPGILLTLCKVTDILWSIGLVNVFLYILNFTAAWELFYQPKIKFLEDAEGLSNHMFIGETKHKIASQ